MRGQVSFFSIGRPQTHGKCFNWLNPFLVKITRTNTNKSNQIHQAPGKSNRLGELDIKISSKIEKITNFVLFSIFDLVILTKKGVLAE